MIENLTFALDHAIFIWNTLPNKRTHWSPNEIFSSVKADMTYVLKRLRVWGCPVYVLDPALQVGKKIPKWNPRARRGVFLGFSKKHSSTVGLILNIATGQVSPQYHVVHDERFSTVTSTRVQAEEMNVDRGTFMLNDWNDLLVCGYNRHPALEEAVENGEPLPMLGDKWMSPAEVEERNALRRHRQMRRIAAGRAIEGAHAPAQPRAVTVPEENEVAQNDMVVIPQLDVVGQIPVPVVAEVQAPPVPTVVEEQIAPVPAVADVPGVNPVPPILPGRRNAGRNKKYFGDEWVNYQTGSSCTGSSQKIRASALDRQYIQSLDWIKMLEEIKSKDLAYFIGKMDVHIEYEDNTVEWVHPHSLAARANPEDNPTWEMAMNGPERAGYWKAMEAEYHTLETEKDSWEVIDRESWMNVLPGTWAFHCK
jgi:hypothetical protein